MEIELLRCERLRAEISRRQCLINQANGQKHPTSIYGSTCSDCDLGRVLAATWEGDRPEVGRVSRCKNHPERQEIAGRGLCWDCLKALGRQPGARPKEKKGADMDKKVQELKPAAAWCKTCGASPAELDKNGRSTGKCKVCQQKHMEANVHRTGRSGLGREMNVYVNFADCPDLLAWLREEAQRQERTPAQQVRFWVRRAREMEAAG